jgi:acetyl esterase/lipase
MTLALTAGIAQAEPLTINLLPGNPPAEPEKVEKRMRGDVPDTLLKDVRWPTITVYLPEKSKANGTAIVICPGGGYGALAIDKEGHDVARWLNSVGVAGVVLKYRMPKPADHADTIPYPQQDAREAIRVVRPRAAEWNLDAGRIGIMGFSAGGHLAATTATRWDEADPATARPSSRPDFAVLVYPVVTLTGPATHTGSRGNLLGKDASPQRLADYSPEQAVTARTPPTFLVHAKDDGVKYANSELFLAACRDHKVEAELFTIEKGGHGFGLGVRGGDAAKWPAALEAWMKQERIVSTK